MAEEEDLITLRQILACRETPLEETELWAVCQECCEVLINVDTSSCDLSMLSITPENIVLDKYGNVNLRILDQEPGFMVDSGNKSSGQALIYSLGMTLIQAASCDRKRARISARLERLLSSMTEENSRIGLDDIIRQCDGELSGLSSMDICCQLAALARNQDLATMSPTFEYEDDLDYESGTLSRDAEFYPQENEYRIPHSTSQHGRRFSNLEESIGLNSPSYSSPHPEELRPQLRSGQAYSPLAAAVLQKQYVSTDLDADINFSDDIGDTLMLDYVSSPDQTGTDSRVTSRLEVTPNYSENSSMTRTPIVDGYRDSDISYQSLRSGNEIQRKHDQFRESGSNHGSPYDAVIRDVRPLKMSTSTRPYSSETDSPNSSIYKQKNPRKTTETASPNDSRGNGKDHNNSRSYRDESNITPNISQQHYRPDNSVDIHRRNNDTNGYSDSAPTPTPSRPSGRSSRATTISRAASVQSNRPASILREKMGSRLSINRSNLVTPSEQHSRIHGDSRSVSVISADYRGSPSSISTAFPEGKTLHEVLITLGCNLEEDEIWALARECVLTVKETNTLPYMSSEHLMLLDNGQAAFIPLQDGEETTGVLPPESDENDEITEKMCVFHLAATLWSAADYGLSDHQEPTLSQHLENLLMTMTSDDPDDRPDFDELMQTLNEVEPTLSMTSEQVCWRLVQDVYNVAGETPSQPPPDFMMNNSICLEDIENDRESLMMTPSILNGGEMRGVPNLPKDLDAGISDSEEEELTPRQSVPATEQQSGTSNSKSSSSLSGNSGSAFRPVVKPVPVYNHDSPLVVPVKTVDGLRSPSNFPSALTSQSTHFAPIPGPIATSEPVNNTNHRGGSGTGSNASTDQNMNKLRKKKDEELSLADLEIDKNLGEGTLTKQSVKRLNSSNAQTFSPLSSHSGSRGASRNEMKESFASVQNSNHGTSGNKYVIENYSPVLSVSICHPVDAAPSPNDQGNKSLNVIQSTKAGSSTSSRNSKQNEMYSPPRGSIGSRDHHLEVRQNVGRRRSGASSRSNTTAESHGYEPTAPESSPSLSRGSGGSAGLGKASLIERLLSSEQSGRQILVKRIASLLRDDLSTHGFIDNAGEDLVIAEYILSLSRLKFSTFTSAILEKYDGYVWSDESLHSLYSIVNGKSGGEMYPGGHSATAKVLSVDEPVPFDPNAFSRRNAHNAQKPMYMSERVLPTYPRTPSKSLVRSDTDSSDSAAEFPGRRSNRRSERIDSTTRRQSLSNLAPRATETYQRRSSRPLSDTASSPEVKSSTDDYPSFGSPQPTDHHETSKTWNGSIHSKHGSDSGHSNANTSILTSVTSLTSGIGHSPPSMPVQWNKRKFDGQSVMFYPFDTDCTLAAGELGVSQDLEMIHTRAGLESKISDIEQQVNMELKMLRKSQNFYEKLMIQVASNQVDGKKAEQKNLIHKVHKQITAATERILKLEEISRYLAVLYADQWGVEHILLSSLAECPSTQPMNLQPNSASHLIQFTTSKAVLRVADAPSVQAGTPLGLMAHLFAKFSVSCGFLHEFFLCYRYFCTTKQVLAFVLDKYIAAVRTPVQQSDNSERVRARALDILSYWMQAYYNLDFCNSDLTEILAEFMRYRLSDSEVLYEDIRALFEECYRGDHSDLSAHEHSVLKEAKCNNEKPKKKENRLLAKLRIPTRTNRTAVISWKTNNEPALDAWDESESDVSFSLMDHSNYVIAEQVTLLEQAMFHEAHPVLFLDSKYHGVNVAMTTSTSTTNLHLLRIDKNTNVWGGPSQPSLFVGTCSNYEIIDRMLEHSHSVSHWVSAQILSSTSTKNQLVLVTKLVLVARHCLRFRNYATALSILNGFEQVIVRQLPVWRSLPAKCVSAMEELARAKEDLKHSNLPVTAGQPAIPSILLFLLQVQQLEHGAFTLANGMYKWTKIRKISRLVDQIRVCMSSTYEFSYNERLISGIQSSMVEYKDRDLQAIASQLPINIHKLPSVKLPQALRKVRKKLQGKD